MCRFPLLLAIVAMTATTSAAGDESILQKLQAGGQVVLMRHPVTDGGPGDPPEKNLKDCTLQRNLSAEGREQAKQIGQALRDRGIRIGKVFAGASCRTTETAKLAFGKAETWSYLNSLYTFPQADQDKRRKVVQQKIASFRGPGNLVLVTHADNIRAWFGFAPPAGGILVVSPAGSKGYTLVGQVAPEAILAKAPDKN